MDKSKPILVTGATGYVAGWIIERLLNQGHIVHATVRDPSKQDKIQHLYDLAEKSSGEIHFFKADLLNAGSFDDAMQNCEIVIHTASPFVVTNFKDAVKDIIEPAVKELVEKQGWEIQWRAVKAGRKVKSLRFDFLPAGLSASLLAGAAIEQKKRP